MKNGDDCVRFKDSYHSNGAVIMDNHPLMIMAREEQRNLLRHPLCLSLGKGTRLLGWTTFSIQRLISISMLCGHSAATKNIFKVSFVVEGSCQVLLNSSDESEPSWLEPELELKDFQLGSARGLFLFSSKSIIGRNEPKFWFLKRKISFMLLNHSFQLPKTPFI